MSCFRCSVTVIPIDAEFTDRISYQIAATELPIEYPYTVYVEEPTNSAWYNQYYDVPQYLRGEAAHYYMYEYDYEFVDEAETDRFKRYRRQKSDVKNIPLDYAVVKWHRVPDSVCHQNAEVMKYPFNFEYWAAYTPSGLSFQQNYWLS